MAGVIQIPELFFFAQVSQGVHGHIGLIVNTGQVKPVLLKLQEERSIGTRAVFRELSKLSGSTFAFKRYSFHFHGTLRPNITKPNNSRGKRSPPNLSTSKTHR